MAKKNKQQQRFVLNDQTVPNSYGFYILTSGINLDRFSQNPVMLSDHYNSNDNVIGNWEDVEQNDTSLSALPVFDTDDDKAAKIAGKVTRGFLRGASMGIIFNPEDLKYVEGNLILTKCVLLEASIVPVPSNQNAVRLYNDQGEIMKEDEITQLCLSAQNSAEHFKPNNNRMKKVMLSLAAFVALGYDTNSLPPDGVDENEINTRVTKLAATNETLKRENEQLKLAAKEAKDAQEAAKKTRVTTAVKLGITQGKISADKEEQFVNLGMSSEEVLMTTLESIPAKQNFGANVTTPEGTNTGDQVKTMDDFEKLDLNAQLAFKNANPEAYSKLFN